ncbi:MAG: alkaline phosphatase family protein [archaeon]
MKKTLIIWLDAVSPDLIQGNMPFLEKLRSGSEFRRFKTHLGFSTSLGATFFTGVTPDRHNQFFLFKRGSNWTYRHFWWMPQMFMDGLNNIVRLLEGKSYFYMAPKGIPRRLLKFFSGSVDENYCAPGSLPVPTLFDKLREKGRRFVYLKWPVFGTEERTTLTFSKNSDERRAMSLISTFSDEVDLYFAYFVDMDVKGHLIKGDNEYLSELTEEDRRIRQVVSEFRGRFPDSNVIIWADHGMVRVKERVDIMSKLNALAPGAVLGSNYLCFLDATVARFWFMDKKSEKLVKGVLSGIKEGKILSQMELKKFGVPADDAYGQLYFLLKPGYLVHPNYFTGKRELYRMHGYSPETKEMEGFFLYSGRAKCPKMKDLKDCYKFLLRLL